MARPRQFSEDRVTKAIRIPAELDEKLKHLAEDRQVSVNLIATWALEDYAKRAKSTDELRRAG